ncbi:MAG TPA: Gfo/Idh/MocA family oxidoreductase [Verrucomicrobiae bacterium]|nr:Gfo/Idh/MocA family oxidoreductase [Verrucomicrobiae bacterium]
MSEKPFRYGLFGVGRCGCVHGETLLSQGQQIVAIGDENPDALAVAARKLGLKGVTAFPTSAAMASAGAIDAVVISTHTKDHARDAGPFVRAGIPVYLEKPLTAELGEGFAFVRSIGKAGNLLQIGLQRRYDEALCHAKSLLDEKLVGEIREIRSILRDQYPPPATYTSRGLIIDMGIHVADEALWLTGEFPRVIWGKMFHSKEYHSPIDEGGDTAHVGFLTPSGTIGRLDLSRTHSSGYNNETYIIGTKGTLHVGRFCGYPGPIHVELWTDQGKLHPASRSFPMTELPKGHAEFQPRFQRAYAIAHTRFREAARARKDFAVTQTDVLDAQVVVEAAHRSALNGGADFAVARSADLAEYEKLCRNAGLIAA